MEKLIALLCICSGFIASIQGEDNSTVKELRCCPCCKTESWNDSDTTETTTEEEEPASLENMPFVMPKLDWVPTSSRPAYTSSEFSRRRFQGSSDKPRRTTPWMTRLEDILALETSTAPGFGTSSYNMLNTNMPFGERMKTAVHPSQHRKCTQPGRAYRPSTLHFRSYTPHCFRDRTFVFHIRLISTEFPLYWQKRNKTIFGMDLAKLMDDDRESQHFLRKNKTLPLPRVSGEMSTRRFRNRKMELDIFTTQKLYQTSTRYCLTGHI